MVTEQEKKIAAEIVLRMAIDDDEMWNELPVELRDQMLVEVINNNVKIPDGDVMHFKALVALCLREQKK